MTGVHDFDLHGLVGIRLVDASAGDVAKVRRQLGPLPTRLAATPDIIVRFTDQIPTEPLTYVGVGEGGYNEDGFFVLNGRGDRAPKARVPFDRVGGPIEIVCERGMPVVPHLLAVINLTALARGVLPLHSSAFTVGGTGVLVTGWAKGGKTESLLGCIGAGGHYVGDEWVYLTADGRMVGLPEPIRLWAWHLQQLPDVLKARPRRDRARLGFWRSASALVDWAGSVTPFAAPVLRKSVPILTRQAYLQLPPVELFGSDAVRLVGSVDAVVLVVSHASPHITVQRPAPGEIAGRMAASLAEERARFMGHYHQYKFAFPGAVSPLVESVTEVEGRLLHQMLDGHPAAKVLHPYPCDIADLGAAVLSAAKTARRSHPENETDAAVAAEPKVK